MGYQFFYGGNREYFHISVGSTKWPFDSSEFLATVKASVKFNTFSKISLMEKPTFSLISLEGRKEYRDSRINSQQDEAFALYKNIILGIFILLPLYWRQEDELDF